MLPCIDQFEFVDLRTVSFDVPPQEVSYVEQDAKWKFGQLKKTYASRPK